MKRLGIGIIALIGLAGALSAAPATGAAARRPRTATSPAGPAADTVTVTVHDTDYDGRLLVELEFPSLPGDEVEIDVEANGTPVMHRVTGSGSGGGRSSRTIFVGPTPPGEEKDLRVTVRGGGRTLHGRARAFYAPAAAILPAWIDGGLLLGSEGLSFQVRLVDDLVMTVNGAPASIGYLKMVPEDGITLSALAEATLRPGWNEIVFTGRSYRGESITHRSEVLIAPDGLVHAGDVFRIVYGREGSRSGPFFSVEVEGDAIRAVGPDDAVCRGRHWEEEAHPWGEPEAHGAPDDRLIAAFVAERPGRATLKIYVKPHFLQDRRLEREIPLRVE